MTDLHLFPSPSEVELVTDIEQAERSNSDWRNKVILGDCLKVLQQMPADTVDLIITSPPYADSRKKTYGGITPDRYVQWFLPISKELIRILKPNGTFILNIKEKVVDGKRHDYVLRLVLEMQNQGWLHTEDYIWHKKNSYPGKWPNRFRDAWERCIQFNRREEFNSYLFSTWDDWEYLLQMNKQKKFEMYQESVMVPMGDWAKSRLRNLSETDRRRDNSKVESGFGKNISNWVDRSMAYPTNVLHFATECGNKSHSAAFPKALPSWFIKLFSQPGDLIFDPFLGSGTTSVAAKELGRDFLGIEIQKDYCNLAIQNIQQATFNAQANAKMNDLDDDYSDYLMQHVLTPFYDKRFEKLGKLKLKDVLKRKNPYLFKAKNIELAQDFVKSIVDAFLSSQEETIFGNLLEGFAIYLSSTLYGGIKSSQKSVDLEFQRDGNYYIVGIKSGTNWGNADQISKMKDNFKKAKQFLRIEQGITCDIVAVNGCMYGKDRNPSKEDLDSEKSYKKYAGQEFWNFIAENDRLYQDMIVPIGEEARQKDELFKATYDAKVNEMTFEFMQYFTRGGRIDWIKLVDYVSKRGDVPLEPALEQIALELDEESLDSEEPLDFADAFDHEEM